MSKQRKNKSTQMKWNNTAAECRNECSKMMIKDSELNARKPQRSPEDYEREIDELKRQLQIKEENIVELTIKLQKYDFPDSYNNGTKKKKAMKMEFDEASCSDAAACREADKAHSHLDPSGYGNQIENEIFSSETVKDNWDDESEDCKSDQPYQCDRDKNLVWRNKGDTSWARGRYDGNNTKIVKKIENNDWKKNYRNPGCRNERHRRYGGENGISTKDEELCCSNITEVNGDLFTAPKKYSLAHCVAEDLKMGSGIAVNFKQAFKRVDELLDQRKKVGQVAILDDNERFVYYLITKKYSEGKPKIDDLYDSLVDMKKHTIAHNVKHLAIPRIGCGLDRLKWKEVQQMLKDVFGDQDINILVFNFTVDPELPVMSTSSTPKMSMRIKEKKRRLIDMEHNTLLIMFGSVNGAVDDTMAEIDKKFPVIADYKMKLKSVGDIITLLKKGEMLCILIVKEHEDDVLSYQTLKKSIQDLLKIFKKENFFYLAFEAFIDNDDDLTVSKIMTCFKWLFSRTDSELWICWPPKYENLFHDSKAGTVTNEFRK